MHDPGFLLLVSLALAGSVFLITLISTDAAIVFLVVSMMWSPEIPLAQVPGRAVVIRFDDLLLGVVFFTWLAKLAINKQLGFLRSTPLNVPVGMFILSCVVSTGWGVINASVTNPTASFFYFLKYFEYFLLFFMAVNVIRERSQLERFLKAMLLTAFLVSLFGYWQIVSHGLGFRVTAPFEGKPEPNTLAGYLIIMMAVSGGVALYAPSRPRRLVCLGLVAMMAVPFVYTYSRGGYMAFIVMYLALCLLSTRHKLLLLSLLVLGGLAAPLVLPETVFQRLTSTFDPIHGVQVGNVRLSQSPAARIMAWRFIFDKWKEHPLLGFGVTGIGFLDSQYALEIGEIGLVGLLVSLWVRWRLLTISYRHFKTLEDPLAKGLSLGFLAGFAGLLLHAFAGNIFIIVRIMEPFWFLAAMVTVLPQVVSPQPAPISRGARVMMPATAA